MALENVAKFEELLRTDEAIKAKMDGLGTAWGGDTADEKAIFEAVIAPIAAEVGLPFTYEEAKESIADMDLDDTELEAVAGGRGFCFLIGCTNGKESNCDEGGRSCVYVGFTMGGSD